jgi:hypothetical protein
VLKFHDFRKTIVAIKNSLAGLLAADGKESNLLWSSQLPDANTRNTNKIIYTVGIFVAQGYGSAFLHLLALGLQH